MMMVLIQFQESPSGHESSVSLKADCEVGSDRHSRHDYSIAGTRFCEDAVLKALFLGRYKKYPSPHQVPWKFCLLTINNSISLLMFNDNWNSQTCILEQLWGSYLKLDQIKTWLCALRHSINVSVHDKRILHWVWRIMGEGSLRSIIGAPRSPEYVSLSPLISVEETATTANSRSIPTGSPLHDYKMGSNSITRSLF